MLRPVNLSWLFDSLGLGFFRLLDDLYFSTAPPKEGSTILLCMYILVPGDSSLNDY